MKKIIMKSAKKHVVYVIGFVIQEYRFYSEI
jgi:hypothetical protein